MHLPEGGAGATHPASRPHCPRGPAQAPGECGYEGVSRTRAQRSTGPNPGLRRELSTAGSDLKHCAKLPATPLSQLEDPDPT